MLFGHLYVLFGEISTYIFCPFFDWFVCFDIELHELLVHFEDKYILVTSFANISSHSVGCLFILFIVSFAVQKLLNLIRSHLFIFISITLGDRLKKILP